jgi:hypothetical protein
MGYTHYWNHTRKFSKPDWERVNDVIDKIIATSINVDIALSVDDGLSRISAHDRVARAWSITSDGTDIIRFNGYQNPCETFVIYRTCPPKASWRDKKNQGFDFCKTQMQPYDSTVTASLIALTSLFPKHITASSDGSLDDWVKGMEIAQEALGSEALLRYPYSVSFENQWSEEIFSGNIFSMMLRTDGALCLVENRQRIIYEFGPEKSEELKEHYRALTEANKDKKFHEIAELNDRELRKLKSGGMVIGGVAPKSQVLGTPD